MRLARGKQLMDQLREDVKWFYETYSGKVEYGDDGTPIIAPPPIPENEAEFTQMLASEVLHHLRAALEHVAYRLAEINRGRPVDGTQFPIEDSPKIFEARVTGSYVNEKGKTRNCAPFLKDIHPKHVDLMRTVQPFPSGPSWLGQLRDLSNEDRHRIPVKAEAFIEQEEGRILAGHSDDARLLGVFGYVHALLVFTPNGERVIETLEVLEREVGALVSAFERLLRSP